MSHKLSCQGTLVISLDFELHWGVMDVKSTRSYKKELRGAREAVPQMLKLFEEYDIHATWASVGFLFCENREELEALLPAKRPGYLNQKISPYTHLDEIGFNEEDDPFHYAPSLIREIQACPNQEIGSHTFSHYYCLEEGQSTDSFEEDLDAAVGVAKNYGITMKSLIFPRNQYNEEHISLCKEKGIRAYRGNEFHWLYRPSNEGDNPLWKQGLRFVDTFINISGHHTKGMTDIAETFPFNIPSSRFLRPQYVLLRPLQSLQLRRIMSDMRHAANQGRVYHLWWHPHNFGKNTEANLDFLKKILKYYTKLQKAGTMRSMNMIELANELSSVSDKNA